jgi:hypothetical protein
MWLKLWVRARWEDDLLRVQVNWFGDLPRSWGKGMNGSLGLVVGVYRKWTLHFLRRIKSGMNEIGLKRRYCLR